MIAKITGRSFTLSIASRRSHGNHMKNLKTGFKRLQNRDIASFYLINSKLLEGPYTVIQTRMTSFQPEKCIVKILGAAKCFRENTMRSRVFSAFFPG